MRTLKVAIPAALALAAFIVSTTATYATPKYAKDTGQKCTVCHAKVAAPADMKKDPNLTATGKCFQGQTDKASLTPACKNAK